MPVVCTLIGDIVESRLLPNRADAQRVLGDSLTDVGRALPGVQPLEPTIGDEFQGAWSDVREAMTAALLVGLGPSAH